LRWQADFRPEQDSQAIGQTQRHHSGSHRKIPAPTVVKPVPYQHHNEVLNIKNEDIEDTPTFGTSLNTDYILGMAKMEGKVKILLDIDQVLGAEDIDALAKAA
jgi:hypothetical protein